MKKTDYTTTLTVETSAKAVFVSINKVTKWWTENLEGKSKKLNDEFTVHFGDVHVSTQKIIELIPDKKVVWLVTHCKLNFIKNEQEWKGTTIHFEIFEKGGKTQIHFTHRGLNSGIECYTDCSNAWAHYLNNSLLSLITTGKGTPGTPENPF